METLRFAQSAWFFAAVPVLAGLAWALWKAEPRRRAALARFASPKLLERLTAGVSPLRRRGKRVFFFLGVACLFFALARPQYGFHWQEVKRRGIDILFALDTSRSMLAEDVAPNRLTRARLGILDFAEKLEGDRTGLIPFAGSAFQLCPMTLDYNAFRESLEAVDTDLIPRKGTDLASAIREARRALAKSGHDHKILVLVTDGEDLQGDALEAAAAAAEEGIVIHTVGVGSPNGELIPVRDDSGQVTGYVLDAQGTPVKSQLDEETLRKIAESTGGLYAPLGQNAEGLDTIYREKLKLVPKEELNQRLEKIPIDRFEWPLTAALVFLLFEFAIGDSRRRRRQRHVETTSRADASLTRKARSPSSVLANSAGRTGLLLLPLIAGFPGISEASPADAVRQFEEGKFAEAYEELNQVVARNPDDPSVKYNLGTAAYRTGDHEAAAEAFRSALATEDLQLQNRTYYNLGNTLYRQGEKEREADPEATRRAWEKSIAAYEGALALGAENSDALFNRDFVKRKLEELNQRQQQDEQNKQGDQSQDQDDQQQQDEQNKQGGQSQDQDDQQQQDEQNKQGGQSQDQDKQKPGRQLENSRPGPESKDEGTPKQPAPQPSSGEDDSRADAIPENRVAGVGERREAGKMSPEEARQLLESLKSDEDRVLLAPARLGRAASTPDNTIKGKDW